MSATTLESMASIPPPSAAVMNSCVLYASSGHFFRRGNGGSKVGPETNHHDPLRFSIFDFFNLRTRGTAEYNTVHELDRLFLEKREDKKQFFDFHREFESIFLFTLIPFFFFLLTIAAISHSYKRTC